MAVSESDDSSRWLTHLALCARDGRVEEESGLCNRRRSRHLEDSLARMLEKLFEIVDDERILLEGGKKVG